MDYVIRIVVNGEGNATGFLGGVQNALGNIGQIAAGGLIANAVSGSVGMVKDLGQQVIEAGFGFNSLKEQAQIAFTTVLDDAGKAGNLIRDMGKMAASTPFEFPQLLMAGKNLVTVGVEANRIIPIMTTLGDATSAMGTGAEGIRRSTLALQQMGTLGRVTGQDMLQLTQAGIPAWDALSASIGKSVSETQDLVSKGLVPAEAMFQALETGAGSALQRVKGMMAEQSKSFEGVLSTLKDNFTQAAGKITEPLFNKVREGMSKLNTLFDSPAVQSGIESIATKLASGLDSVLTFVTGTLLPALQNVFKFIVQNADLVKTVLMAIGTALAGAAILGPILSIGAAIVGLLNPITLVIVAIGILAAAWARNWGNIRGVAGSVLAYLQPILQRIAQIVQQQIIPALQKLGGFINVTVLPALRAFADWLGPRILPLLTKIGEVLGNVVVKAFQDLATNLSNVANNAQAFANALGQAFQWVLDKIADFVQKFGELLNMIPGMAGSGDQLISFAGRMRTAFEALTISVAKYQQAARDAEAGITRTIPTVGALTTAAYANAEAMRAEALGARRASDESKRAALSFTQAGQAGLAAAKGIDVMAKAAEKVRGMVEQALQPTTVEARLKMTGNAWDEFRLRLEAVNSGTPLDAYGPAFVEQVKKMQEVTGLALPDMAAKFKDFSLFARMDWLKAALDSGAVDLTPIKEQIQTQINQIIGFANLAKAAFDEVWASMDAGQKIDLAKALGLDASGANIEALKTNIQSAVTGAMTGIDSGTLPGTQGAQALGQATGILAKGIQDSAKGIETLTPLLKPLGEQFAGLLPKVSDLNPPMTTFGGLWTQFRNDTKDLGGLLETTQGNLQNLTGVVAGDATTAFTNFLNNVAIPLRDVFSAISGLLGDIKTQLEGIAELLNLMKAPKMLERNSPSPLEMALMNSNTYLGEMAGLLKPSLGALQNYGFGGARIPALDPAFSGGYRDFAGGSQDNRRMMYFNGPITVRANNAREFWNSMREWEGEINTEENFVG